MSFELFEGVQVKMQVDHKKVNYNNQVWRRQVNLLGQLQNLSQERTVLDAADILNFDSKQFYRWQRYVVLGIDLGQI